MVFLTVFLNMNYSEVNKLLNSTTPSMARECERKRFKNSLRSNLYFKSIAISLAFIFLFYLLLPKTIDIISYSKIDFWNFDINLTLFVFIESAISVFIVISVSTNIKLVLKLFK